MSLVEISRRLSKQVSGLSFTLPVTHVYNPLDYARAPHEAYLRRYGEGKRSVVLLGMNPGPFGMAQTGVPFGDVAMVRDWLGISGAVGCPSRPHPKRPVDGFACARAEVSGTRLWGWARDTFASPDRFFKRFFVVNYCPLVFMEESGRNRTPDKLSAVEREPLYASCDEALRSVVALLEPEWVIGVGKFGEARAQRVLGANGPKVSSILHPSPASPAANRGWAAAATRQLESIVGPLA